MNDKMKKYIKSKPREDVEKAFDKALLILYSIEYFLSISIYMALKAYVSLFWAEIFMAFVFARTLWQNFEAMKPKLKQETMDSFEDKHEEDKSKPEEKQAEDNQT